MSFTPINSAIQSQSSGVHCRELLENNYHRSSLVEMSIGSSIPLLKRHFWLIIQGFVKLGCVTEYGDNILLGLAGPNELFGESLAGPEPFEVTAISECQLLCVSTCDLLDKPNLTPLLVNGVTHRQRQSQAMLAVMGIRRVEDRLRSFLELMALEYGETVQNGLRLQPKLTHQEIANAIGSTRVTVTRLIGQLKEIGWLRLDVDRSIILPPLPTPKT